MRNKFLNTGQPGFHPLRKICIVIRGLKFAVLSDFSVAYKLVLSIVVLAACIAFRDWIDVAAVLIATAVMIIAEILNTAIEALCDFIEPEKNPRIGMIKDIAAAAVGISILLWLIVLVVESYAVVNHLIV
ncbi:diacylglycerol kinase [Cellvibrio sp. pealriver]|uniref:diacylglycerol kinase n=1 Tax=Cellvibrio sp. pealriver TaxID=1622269 RepID=UPI00066FD811|nr:diacylglycerol kinase [Cellvibrio sp. pealriver]